MKNFTFFKFTFIYLSLFLISNKASLEESKIIVIGGDPDQFKNDSRYVFLDDKYKDVILNLKDENLKKEYFYYFNNLGSVIAEQIKNLGGYAGEKISKAANLAGENLKKKAEDVLSGLADFLKDKKDEASGVLKDKYNFYIFFNAKAEIERNRFKKFIFRKEFLEEKDIKKFEKETDDFLKKIEKNKKNESAGKNEIFTFNFSRDEQTKKNAKELAESKDFQKAFVRAIEIKNDIIKFDDTKAKEEMKKQADNYIEFFRKTVEKESINPSLKILSAFGFGLGSGFFVTKNKEKIREGFNKFFKVSKNEIKNSFGFLKSKIFRK